MTLQELIDALSAEDPTQVCRLGFGSPHSYRGDYAQLAVEPAADVTVGEMLAAINGALGSTYEGYKGGDYVMSEYVSVFLAQYGECGEEIGPFLLRFMLGRDPFESEEQG